MGDPQQNLCWSRTGGLRTKQKNKILRAARQHVNSHHSTAAEPKPDQSPVEIKPGGDGDTRNLRVAATPAPRLSGIWAEATEQL